MLAIDVQVLNKLRMWPACGALLMDLELTRRGEGGLSREDIRRLRSWAQRFRRLKPVLQEFYTRNCGSTLAHQALWVMLATHDEVPVRVRGMLKRIFIEQEGYEPSFSVAPRLRRTRRDGKT